MHPPRTLSINELTSFLAAIQARGIAPELAAKTLLLTGLRVAEFLHLRWQDVVGLDYQPRAVLLIRKEWAKGKTERTIPLPPQLQDTYSYYLERHLDERKRYPALHWPLWPGDREVGFKLRHLQDLFRQCGRKSINRVVTPHMFRHTYASNLLALSNTAIVQQALGHKSLTSTQIYLHPTETQIAEAANKLLDRFSPEGKDHAHSPRAT